MITAAQVTTGFRFRDFDRNLCAVVYVDATSGTYTYECPNGRLETSTIENLVTAINTGWVTKARRSSAR